LRTLIAILAAGALSGCYYVQAARGQLELLRAREPIAEVVTADDTSPELARRLQVIEAARAFSVESLDLPDNDSYRSYADVGRDYVVWNVFAAPEFSLDPKRWCYPVAGCVAYRGYFDESKARDKAAELAARGFDVAVAGVPAYSTLGRFDDPVLNTMLRWDDVDLVAMLFHELAHQELYVKGDTGFNESFATFVEQIGIERWLSARGQAAELEDYRARRQLRSRLMDIVTAAHPGLQELYASSLAAHEMRREKLLRFDQLAAALRAEITSSGGQVPAWLEGGLNNARLASLTLYESRLPEFRELYRACDEDLGCFYAAARRHADEDV